MLGAQSSDGATLSLYTLVIRFSLKFFAVQEREAEKSKVFYISLYFVYLFLLLSYLLKIYPYYIQHKIVKVYPNLVFNVALPFPASFSLISSFQFSF